MIYDKYGNALSLAFDKSGNILPLAFDKSGNIIYQQGSLSTLKVMSYNVGGWYTGKGSNVPADQDTEYLALQTGMISRADVDVLCIQEYMTQFSRLPRTADSILEPYFPYRNCRQNGTYYGRGICSKYELLDYTVNTYTDDTSRYYDKAYIEVDGKTIAIFTTHFSLTFSNRQQELTQLMAAFQNEEYFICCGDYNTLSIANGETIYSEDYVAIVKPLLDAGYRCANWSNFGFLVTNSGEPESAWVGCIDSIITSPNMYIEDVYVDTTKLEDDIQDKVDHMPIIATLKIY